MSRSDDPIISIVIPVQNEARNVGRCLRQVFMQRIEFPYEVLVIDSGSTDGTIEVIQELDNPRIRIQKIPAADFGHGKTRNLGARLSRGKYLVFLNGDAFPLNHRWLGVLYEAVQRHIGGGAAFSRHIPRRDCHLYMQRDIRRSFPASPKTCTTRGPCRKMMFSTVSCMVRRDILLRHPFQEDIEIAEDREWAIRMRRENAAMIAYAPDSVVVHSHNYSARQLFTIKRRVARSDPAVHRLSLITWRLPLIIGGGICKFMADLGYIIVRKGIPPGRKMKQIGVAAAARFHTFSGKYIGWWEGQRHG